VAHERDRDLGGFLEGTEGPARAAREQLLRELLEAGCTVDELREAVEQDRLALLPGERILQRDERFVERYTADEVAELAGVELADLRFANAALGLPMGRPGERCHTEADLELAHLLKVGLDAGVAVEAIAELNRVIVRGVVAMAASSRTIAIEAAVRPGTTERDAALMWARAAEYLVPNTTRVITLAFESHLRRLVRDIYISGAEIVAGRTPGAETVTIAFADLVGFTQLGRTVGAEDLGRVARLLEETTSRMLEPGVSIVKTIGDAVMLVSREPSPLLETLLALVEAGRPPDAGLPEIRAGVAFGPALERAGDWFGDTVNLASRITGVADPSSVVAVEAVRRAAGDGYRWEYVGEPQLKGVDEAPRVYRVLKATDGREG
jgi:adenylate cyclase